MIEKLNWYEKIRKTLYIILQGIAVILAICSILSIFRNTESRYLKYLDFPRIQFFVASILCLAVGVIAIKRWRWYDYLLIVALLCGLIINGSYLINYTNLVSEEVPAAKEIKASDDQLSILIANVKMTNRKALPLIKLIENKKPDLILAMEVNDWWNKQLKVLENEYPYSQHTTINDVTYGMVLFSKFPLEKIEVHYLHNKKVLSFESTITLAGGKTISFHSMHPVPPTHFKDLPDNEGQQETALKKAGKKIKERKLPTILAGDLNDVVWSHVDKLTGTAHLLYDVRVGRGFYNSYNAENILMDGHWTTFL